MNSPDAAALTLYGLPNCATCRRARAWLERSGRAFVFVDYRERRIDAETLSGWARAHGWAALINRQSTTWRGLLPQRKNPGTAPEFLLLLKEYPTLLRRPVLVVDGAVTVGFSDSLYRRAFAKQD